MHAGIQNDTIRERELGLEGESALVNRQQDNYGFRYLSVSTVSHTPTHI